MSEPRLTEIRNKNDLRMGFDRDDYDYLLDTIETLTAERDGAMRGAREGTAALTAERDALLVRVERLEEALSDLLSDLLGWECGGKEYIRRLHYERVDGKCDYCTGAWPCPAIEAQAVLTPEPGEPG